MDTSQFDRRVAHALQSIADGRPSGVADLYDLLGDSVYRLSLTFTGEGAKAEAATKETFTRIRQSPPALLRRSAVQWVRELACETACRQR